MLCATACLSAYLISLTCFYKCRHYFGLLIIPWFANTHTSGQEQICSFDMSTPSFSNKCVAWIYVPALNRTFKFFKPVSEGFNIPRDLVILIVALGMTALYDAIKNLYNLAFAFKIPNWDILFAFSVTTGVILLALRFLTKSKTMEKSTRI